MATNRVVVLLSDEELEQVQARAGLVPLSAWFRALAFPKQFTVEAKETTLPVLDTAPPTDGIGKVSLPSVRGTKLPEKPTEVRSGRMVFRRKE